jgi:hypothetical protein
MKKGTKITIGVLAAAAVVTGIVLYKKSKSTALTVEEKRRYLQSIDGDFRPDPFNRFNAQEIIDSYEWVQSFNGDKVVKLPSPELRARIQIISSKYNIFN